MTSSMSDPVLPLGSMSPFKVYTTELGCLRDVINFIEEPSACLPKLSDHRPYWCIGRLDGKLANALHELDICVSAPERLGW